MDRMIVLNAAMAPGMLAGGSERFTVSAALSATTAIRDVKTLIQQSLSSHPEPDVQFLLFGGIRLIDDHTLYADLRMARNPQQTDFTIHVLVRGLQDNTILPPAFIPAIIVDDEEASCICCTPDRGTSQFDVRLFCGCHFHTNCLIDMIRPQIDGVDGDGYQKRPEEPHCMCRKRIGRSSIPLGILGEVLAIWPFYTDNLDELTAASARALPPVNAQHEETLKRAGILSRHEAALSSGRHHQRRCEYIQRQNPPLRILRSSDVTDHLRPYTTMVTPAAKLSDRPIGLFFEYTEKITGSDVVLKHTYHYIVDGQDTIRELVALWASAVAKAPVPVGVSSTCFKYGDKKLYGEENLAQMGIVDGETLTLESRLM